MVHGNAITMPERSYRSGTNIENGIMTNQVVEYSAVNALEWLLYHRLDYYGAQFHKEKRKR